MECPFSDSEYHLAKKRSIGGKTLVHLAIHFHRNIYEFGTWKSPLKDIGASLVTRRSSETVYNNIVKANIIQIRFYNKHN